MSPPRLDEPALRRPDLDPDSVPIEIPGQGTWLFAPPRIRWTRGRTPGGPAAVAHLGGPDYQALVDRLHAATSNGEVFAALIDLGAACLRRNYDLGDEQIDALLWIETVPDPDAETPGARRLPDHWERIQEVALALPPKSRAAVGADGARVAGDRS